VEGEGRARRRVGARGGARLRQLSARLREAERGQQRRRSARGSGARRGSPASATGRFGRARTPRSGRCRAAAPRSGGRRLRAAGGRRCCSRAASWVDSCRRRGMTLTVRLWVDSAVAGGVAATGPPAAAVAGAAAGLGGGVVPLVGRGRLRPAKRTVSRPRFSCSRLGRLPACWPGGPCKRFGRTPMPPGRRPVQSSRLKVSDAPGSRVDDQGERRRADVRDAYAGSVTMPGAVPGRAVGAGQRPASVD
jgi:hypothetical protein